MKDYKSKTTCLSRLLTSEMPRAVLISNEIEASGTQQKGLIWIDEAVWDYQVHCCLITGFIWILYLCNTIEVGRRCFAVVVTQTHYIKSATSHIAISLTTSLISMNSNVSLKDTAQLNKNTNHYHFFSHHVGYTVILHSTLLGLVL